MKISIIGFSGSGKSTLAKNLSRHYNIPVMHMDSINFKENWILRDKAEFNDTVKKFIDDNESWIIDGNYKSTCPERHEKADLLIFLDYNRFFCYRSAKKRYKIYKGKTREDMASGCDEKFDKEFRKWLLFEGRTKSRRQRLLQTAKNHSNSLIFKNRKQLFNYLSELGLEDLKWN